MDGIQANILLTKIRYIKNWTSKRIEAASYYSLLLKDLKHVKTPSVRENTKHAFHVYQIEAENRDLLKNFLTSCGISCSIHYQLTAILRCYEYLNYNHLDYPVVSELNKIISYKIFPELRNQK